MIAVGRRPPAWVAQGWEEFARRLPPECALVLTEVAAPRRHKGADCGRLMEREGAALRAAVPRGAYTVALDERGEPWTTAHLARKLSDWLQSGHDVAMLIGGPDGLAPACREAAHARWSLSPLTLPHTLCRILVAEQVYRAWTLLSGHPYHRGD